MVAEKRKLQRKSGSGKGELSRTLFVKANGTRPLQHEKVGIREAQELEHTSRRLHGPRCHGRLLAAFRGKMESMWLGSAQLDCEEELGLCMGCVA